MAQDYDAAAVHADYRVFVSWATHPQNPLTPTLTPSVLPFHSRRLTFAVGLGLYTGPVCTGSSKLLTDAA